MASLAQRIALPQIHYTTQKSPINYYLTALEIAVRFESALLKNVAFKLSKPSRNC
jgi:hypothetical protein